MREHLRAIHTWHSALAKEMGVSLLDKGLHTYALKNGARFTVYACPYTPRFGDSAFQHDTREDRFDPESLITQEAISVAKTPVPDFPGVDIIMTHGPPKYLLDSTPRNSNVGCPHLRKAIQRAKPRLHCFGHVHSGWGLQTVMWDQGGDEETDDGYTMLPKAFVGENQSKRQQAAFQDLSSTGDSGMEHGKAIMEEDNLPTHAPWLVDLDLNTM
jgi:hypothetical protein